jgi:RimJ/RimL family protein N-acetyltransferase
MTERDWVSLVAAGPCPECGFDAPLLGAGDLADAARDEGRRWSLWAAAVVGDDRVGRRPAPPVWSALEYTAHVRDVFEVFEIRVGRMLAEDDPELGWWDHDAAVVGYAGLNVADVVSALEAGASRLAATLDGVSGRGWDRTGVRRPGERFTVAGLVRYALHESFHHRGDADRSLTRQWDGVALPVPVGPGRMSRVALSGSRVRLEPISRSHIPGLATASTEGRDTYGLSWVPNGWEDGRAYVDRALAGEEAGFELAFATISVADGRVVGSTRFTNMETWTWPPGHPQQRVGVPDVVEIGWTWLAPSAQRTGINREAKLLMLTYAFDVWRVHRVCLRTDVRNVRSQTAMLGIGATCEGVRRAERLGADGTVRDSMMFSIVAAEWPEARDRLNGARKI